MTDDFITTIDSGDEEVPVPSISKQSKGKQKPPEMRDETAALDPTFTFDLTGDAFADVFHEEVTFQDVVRAELKPVRRCARFRHGEILTDA